jgi:hypothetical protein
MFCCVSVALVSQHVKYMHCVIVICDLACLVLPLPLLLPLIQPPLPLLLWNCYYYYYYYYYYYTTTLPPLVIPLLLPSAICTLDLLSILWQPSPIVSDFVSSSLDCVSCLHFGGACCLHMLEGFQFLLLLGLHNYANFGNISCILFTCWQCDIVWHNVQCSCYFGIHLLKLPMVMT